jgi:prephenate dehydrogenase
MSSWVLVRGSLFVFRPPPREKACRLFSEPSLREKVKPFSVEWLPYAIRFTQYATMEHRSHASAHDDALQHVTLLGTGTAGASLALAWKAARPELVVTGLDEPEALERAEEHGVIDRKAASLDAAAAGADLVVLAERLPVALRRLEALAPHLPDGALVTDTGAAKQPIARHAAEVLPERASFVGGHPIASSERRGETEPEATRFDGGTYLLCPGEEASREAALATRQLREHHPGFLALAEATGARVQVRSPAHHDRLCAAARDLPELLAATLTDVISEAAEDAGDHETLLALTDPALRPLVWGRQAPSAERREELVAGEGSLLDALGRYVRALQQTRRHLAIGDLDAALSLGDGGS